MSEAITTRIAAGGGGTLLRTVIRPFADRDAGRLDRIDKLRPIEGETRQAALCIGGPSADFLRHVQPGLRVTWPEDHDEEEEGLERPRYRELQAVVRDIRVTSPNDDDVWVDVTARNASLIQTDQGNEFWIDWLQDLSSQPRAE